MTGMFLFPHSLSESVNHGISDNLPEFLLLLSPLAISPVRLLFCVKIQFHLHSFFFFFSTSVLSLQSLKSVKSRNHRFTFVGTKIG